MPNISCTKPINIIEKNISFSLQIEWWQCGIYIRYCYLIDTIVSVSNIIFPRIIVTLLSLKDEHLCSNSNMFNKTLPIARISLIHPIKVRFQVIKLEKNPIWSTIVRIILWYNTFNICTRHPLVHHVHYKVCISTSCYRYQWAEMT